MVQRPAAEHLGAQRLIEGLTVHMPENLVLHHPGGVDYAPDARPAFLLVAFQEGDELALIGYIDRREMNRCSQSFEFADLSDRPGLRVIRADALPHRAGGQFCAPGQNKMARATLDHPASNNAAQSAQTAGDQVAGIGTERWRQHLLRDAHMLKPGDIALVRPEGYLVLSIALLDLFRQQSDAQRQELFVHSSPQSPQRRLGERR